MVDMPYEDFIRSRITELRMARDVSEHRMSLELGKSGSYIHKLCEQLRTLSDEDLDKVATFINWITK